MSIRKKNHFTHVLLCPFLLDYSRLAPTRQKVADMTDTEYLLYEFPCNEKIRTHLRLELLFKRYAWFCEQSDPTAHQTAISALFDVLDATARSDLRNELIQELERQRRRMESLLGNPDVDQEKLRETITEIRQSVTTVADTVGRTGQSIRENQWLQIIRTRQTIAGGTCEFDLPQLHYWMNKPAEERRAELYSYVSSLMPIRDASAILLRFLRASAEEHQYTTDTASFQFPMTNRQLPALAQIWVPTKSNVIPEVSANKYMLWIRFSRPDAEHKLHPVHAEKIPFRMGICTLQ